MGLSKTTFLRCLVFGALLNTVATAGAVAARIELVDGSTLNGTADCPPAGNCTVHLNSGQSFDVPPSAIRSIGGFGTPAAPGTSPAPSSSPLTVAPPAPQPPPAPESPPAPVPAASGSDNGLRVAGSNTIGAQLMPALLIDYARSKGAADTATVPVAAEEVTLTPNPAIAGLWPRMDVRAPGSGFGFKSLAALAAGRQGAGDARQKLEAFAAGQPEADIAMASRKIKPEETAVLASLGALDDPNSEHVIALDGLAIIVNPANSAGALSIDQIKGIFTGTIGDWSQVGGVPGPISLYARKDGSGTLDTFKDIVLQGAALSPNATRIEDSRELSAAVARDAGAIGFVGVAYVGEAKAVSIRECNLTYAPSKFNIKTEEYPLSRRLFLYTPADSSPAIDDFIRYTNSDSAQKVASDNDFVDLEVESDSSGSQNSRRAAALATADQPHPADNFATITRHAERLSLTLRFRTNTHDLDRADLDSRAIHDVDRLAAYMNSPEGHGHRLLLIGFSDSEGNYRYNTDLSRSRAHYVADRLKKHGITVADSDIYGFGPALPVACNTTDNGKAKNRHVEVWMTR